MGKYTKWVTYKDKRMLTVDVAGLDEVEVIAGFEEMKQELFKDRGAPLVLVDITGIDMTTAVINKAKELTVATKEAGLKDGPNVLVGLTGLQKAVARWALLASQSPMKRSTGGRWGARPRAFATKSPT